MLHGFLLSIVCLACIFSIVDGTAILVPTLSSVSCSGNLQNVSLTSVTCDYSESGCTYGSEVFVTGQVYANRDIPRPMVVKMSRTLPSFYALGTNVYKGEIEDVCDDTIASVSDDDAENSCPSEGLYNFHFKYANFGTRQHWYAGWHGYSMGLVVHFKSATGGKDYATCTINVKAEAPDDEDYSYATNASFVCVAMVGLSGLLTSLFVRKRKERLECSQQQNVDNGRTKELNTNFELIQDSSSSAVV